MQLSLVFLFRSYTLGLKGLESLKSLIILRIPIGLRRVPTIKTEAMAHCVFEFVSSVYVRD